MRPPALLRIVSMQCKPSKNHVYFQNMYVLGATSNVRYMTLNRVNAHYQNAILSAHTAYTGASLLHRPLNSNATHNMPLGWEVPYGRSVGNYIDHKMRE